VHFGYPHLLPSTGTWGGERHQRTEWARVPTRGARRGHAHSLLSGKTHLLEAKSLQTLTSTGDNPGPLLSCTVLVFGHLDNHNRRGQVIVSSAFRPPWDWGSMSRFFLKELSKTQHCPQKAFQKPRVHNSSLFVFSAQMSAETLCAG